MTKSLHARYRKLSGFTIALLTLVVAMPARADFQDLLVTGIGNGSVSDFNPTTGATNAPFIAPGGPNLTSPRGIAIGANNEVYVDDISKNAIQVFNGTTGALVNSIALGPFTQPYGMAFSPTNGNLFVSSFNGTNGTNSVNEYTPAGVQVPFTLTGLPGSPGLQQLAGLTFDSAGNLYVVSGGANAVLEFNSAGAFQKAFTAPGMLVAPSGLAINNAGGELFVGDGAVGSNSIATFSTTTGTFLGLLSNANLDAPGGLLFDPKTNRLYVASDQTNTVLALNSFTGALDTTFNSPNGVAGTGANSQPIYLALAPTPVPEPSAIALLAFGIVGAFAAVRRTGRKRV